MNAATTPPHNQLDLRMKLLLNTDFLNQNTLLAVLACAQVTNTGIEVEPSQDSTFRFQPTPLKMSLL